MKKLFLLFLLVLVVFSLLNADYLIKLETETDRPVAGQSQIMDFQSLWIGDSVYTNITGIKSKVVNIKQRIVIINSKKKIMFVVYPKTKTYVEMKLPLNLSEYLPEGAKDLVNKLFDSMNIEVTSNGKSGKVGDWNTKGYSADMSMETMGLDLKINMDISASKDVPFDWKKLSTEYMGNMMMSTGKMSSKVMDEMKKIEGYIIKMVMTYNTMGKKFSITQKVIDIIKKDAPAGIYEVPTGYKKVDKLKHPMGII